MTTLRSRKEYKKRYQAANAEKIAAYQKRWREENRERSMAQQKIYREAHREKKAIQNKLWKAANPEKVRENGRRFYAENRIKEAARGKLYCEKNAVKVAAHKRRYRIANLGKCAAAIKRWATENKAAMRSYTAKHKARKLNATPPWAEPELIELIYAEAVHRGMEVDHIIPLQGKMVCGLHVHNNMQLLTRSQNSAKRNRFEPMRLAA